MLHVSLLVCRKVHYVWCGGAWWNHGMSQEKVVILDYCRENSDSSGMLCEKPSIRR